MGPEEIMRRLLLQEDARVEIAPETLMMRLFQLVDYSATTLTPDAEMAVVHVREAAQAIYGDRWNFYSNALRREVVKSFDRSVEAAVQNTPRVDYLEIGSCQGVSMSLVGLLLRRLGTGGALTSVDPYFPAGYREGAKGPWRIDFEIRIDKQTRDAALRLYRDLGLAVELIEKTSLEGLPDLIRQGRRYGLIYIDGSHEGLHPVTDFGLCRALLAPGGVIMLDDHYWPDVIPLRELCKRHARQVTESWKIAAYQFPE